MKISLILTCVTACLFTQCQKFLDVNETAYCHIGYSDMLIIKPYQEYKLPFCNPDYLLINNAVISPDNQTLQLECNGDIISLPIKEHIGFLGYDFFWQGPALGGQAVSVKSYD